MVFVGLDDVGLALQRVQYRATRGGHDVPADVQNERFGRVFTNARKAIQIVPLAIFFDNSRDRAVNQRSHRPVAVFKSGLLLAQHDNLPAWWPLIYP